MVTTNIHPIHDDVGVFRRPNRRMDDWQNQEGMNGKACVVCSRFNMESILSSPGVRR